MKLNYDCLRDVLLVCESKAIFTESLIIEPVYLHDLFTNLPDYSHADIAYSVIMLGEADYIDYSPLYADGALSEAYIERLTYTGHEFLDSIRTESVWKKTSRVLSKLGSFSLPLISGVAQQILTDSASHILANMQ